MFISKSLQPFVKSDFEGESPLFDLFIWPLQSLTPATPHLVCMLDFSVICMQQARISFSPSWVGQAGRCVMVARRHRDLNNFVYVQSTTVHRTRVTLNDLQSSQDGHPLFFGGKKTNVKSLNIFRCTARLRSWFELIQQKPSRSQHPPAALSLVIHSFEFARWFLALSESCQQ